MLELKCVATRHADGQGRGLVAGSEPGARFATDNTQKSARVGFFFSTRLFAPAAARRHPLYLLRSTRPHGRSRRPPSPHPQTPSKSLSTSNARGGPLKKKHPVQAHTHTTRPARWLRRPTPELARAAAALATRGALLPPRPATPPTPHLNGLPPLRPPLRSRSLAAAAAAAAAGAPPNVRTAPPLLAAPQGRAPPAGRPAGRRAPPPLAAWAQPPPPPPRRPPHPG